MGLKRQPVHPLRSNPAQPDSFELIIHLKSYFNKQYAGPNGSCATNVRCQFDTTVEYTYQQRFQYRFWVAPLWPDGMPLAPSHLHSDGNIYVAAIEDADTTLPGHTSWITHLADILTQSGYSVTLTDTAGLDSNLSSEARLTIRGAIPVGQEDICGQPLGLRVRNMGDGDGNTLPPNYTLTCADEGIWYDRTVTTTEDHFFGWAPNSGDCAAPYEEPCYTYDWGFSVTPTSPIGCSYPEAPAAGVAREPAVQAALVQGYRFGFQAQEADHEEYGGYGKWEYKYRGHNPAIGRWTSVDPVAQAAPGWSPYRSFYCNPLKYIDSTVLLESTHTDEDGNIIAVYNDGDNGVYKHANGTTKEDLDRRHGSLVLRNPTSSGGERMGETKYWDEFVSPETG